MYDFLTSTGAWIAFTIFFFGMIIRIVYLYGLSRGKDPVLYNHVDMKWGLKSILYWIIPLGSVSLRSQPVFSIVVFIFHLFLLVVPIFLMAHNLLLDEAWGVTLFSMPDMLADIMTIAVVLTGLFLLIRRIIRPEVRIITEIKDYVLLILTILPFITGFIAYHQLGDNETFLILHIIFSEILLILIPFTKLGHMVLFFFTRAFIGFEMGTRRGCKTW
ncbi:MAG: nitrate reductase [Desulfobacterales bacterium]|nr:nitrate reductase [Desulfobacterales bacterium]